MGIKHLNRYLKSSCKKGILPIDIDTLAGKTIVVDTSIYIYKFLEDNVLLENFFIMIIDFRGKNVTPLFVFDGKPNRAKMDVIWKRITNKQKAKKQYDFWKEKYEHAENTKSTKQVLWENMERQRKRSTRVKESDIRELKDLFDALGVFYYDAPMEADSVCAYFVENSIAWGCMSDDMDMFVYGCNKVIREWSIEKKCGTLYDRNQIMKEVRVAPEYFSCLLLVLGSDYHQDISEEDKIKIDTAFKWYDEFQKYETNSPDKQPAECFYNWLKRTNKMKEENAGKLLTIFNMYQIPEYTYSVSTREPVIKWDVVQKIMGPYGFIISPN